MSSYQVLNIFFGLEEDDLLEIQSAALTAIKAGLVVVSWTGAGQGVTKQWAMPPKEMLLEANAALRDLKGTRVRKTYPRFV
jgi:hypothetical protein